MNELELPPTTKTEDALSTRGRLVFIHRMQKKFGKQVGFEDVEMFDDFDDEILDISILESRE